MYGFQFNLCCIRRTMVQTTERGKSELGAGLQVGEDEMESALECMLEQH